MGNRTGIIRDFMHLKKEEKFTSPLPALYSRPYPLMKKNIPTIYGPEYLKSKIKGLCVLNEIW